MPCAARLKRAAAFFFFLKRKERPASATHHPAATAANSRQPRPSPRAHVRIFKKSGPVAVPCTATMTTRCVFRLLFMSTRRLELISEALIRRFIVSHFYTQHGSGSSYRVTVLPVAEIKPDSKFDSWLTCVPHSSYPMFALTAVSSGPCRQHRHHQRKRTQ